MFIPIVAPRLHVKIGFSLIAGRILSRHSQIPWVIQPFPPSTILLKGKMEKDPHKILGIAEDSPKEEIKRAYRKLQFKYHPDRPEGDAEKYKEIAQAYERLMKGEKKLTKFDIMKFEKEYKNSEEEKNDIIGLYKKYKGDMFKIIDNLVLATDNEEERIRGIIDDLMESGKLEKYKRYETRVSDDRKRARKRKREEREAKKRSEEEGISSIQEVMRKNHEKQNKLIQDLEEKYCSSSQSKKKKK
jgi:DnaJ family protein C protein 9